MGLPRGEVGPRPIAVDRLTKRYGSATAVDDLSFTAEPGRITGFLGPNGAGKTTTLRVLVGLIEPTSGSARFGGERYRDFDCPQRVVGCVFEPAFHPGRSGRNHLRVLAATAGVDDARVDEVLDLVDLTPAAHRSAGGYSLGMRQRLALAAALLGDPAHLILDEPANGLDPEGIRWLRGFLRRFAAGGRTVLISSHLLAEVQATVDDVVVIARGRLLRQARMADLAVAEGSARVRVHNPERARYALVELDEDVELAKDADGTFVRVHSIDLAAIGIALFDAGIPVLELTQERYDLEERFFALLGADAS